MNIFFFLLSGNQEAYSWLKSVNFPEVCGHLAQFHAP